MFSVQVTEESLACCGLEPGEPEPRSITKQDVIPAHHPEQDVASRALKAAKRDIDKFYQHLVLINMVLIMQKQLKL